MSNPQKNKGKRYERDIAKFLTDTFNKPFMRVPNSGAFTGGKNQTRIANMSAGQVKGQRGDIIAPDEYNFILECKNHRNFSTGFVGIMKSSNAKLDGWLDEVYKDAENGKVPYALVFKITGGSSTSFFALPEHIFKLNLATTPYTRYKHPTQGLFYIIIPQDTFVALAQDIELTIRT